MNVTLPKRLAVALSVITAIGTPLAAYARARGWIGSAEVEVWSAEVAVVGVLTGLHIGTSTPAAPVADDLPLVVTAASQDDGTAPAAQ